jgi:non-specific serine/threonine protein kinase
MHGETDVKKRQSLVQQFQENDGVPFFVLSLKAGGSGLNLTAASHVIHFDRWWNPAVENQATDRAFRIGQTKNVLVHKFLCRGTVEERIDELIESKQQLSRDLLEGGADLLLTEMKDDELLKLVALDLRAASQE